MKKFIVSANIDPNHSYKVNLGSKSSEMKEETFELLMNYLKLSNLEYCIYFQGENFKSVSFDLGDFNIYVFETTATV